MIQMKFFSYSNENNNYTMAVALDGIRSIHLCNGEGKSAIRYSVRVEYANGRNEQLPYLRCDESKRVYETILELLNK